MAGMLERLAMPRDLLDRASRLSPWRLAIVRREAQRVGDQCYYCLGWNSALPGQNSRFAGSASEKLDRLLKLTRANAVKKRGPGAPRWRPDFMMAILGTLSEYETRIEKGERKTVVINDLIDRGTLDKTKTTDFHKKRFDRWLRHNSK